jgi:regulator of cell morphogenesis and NO signaling
MQRAGIPGVAPGEAEHALLLPGPLIDCHQDLFQGDVELARRVEKVHAGKPECPAGLADHLEAMGPFVADHLGKEEELLFPLILSGHGRHATMPVQVMMREHDDHGEGLRRIRELTNDLRLPEGACATWRELYRALAQLETELMEHIHLENNVLFPRALVG